MADLAFETGNFSDAKTYVNQQRDILMDEDAPFTLFKLALITFFGNKDSSSKAYCEKLAPTLVDSTGSFKEDDMATKVGAILGICYLNGGHFRQAVAIFLNLNPNAMEGINDIVVAEDIATYITLGALATFSRAELGFLSKSDSVFLALAEGSSQNLPHLITLLLNSRFAELFERLAFYNVDYLLDPNLYGVLSELFYRIRVRAFVQYLSVFSNVSLDTMAQAFNISAVDLEEEIKQLIESKTVHILIDQKNRILVCKHQDVHFNLFRTADMAADRFLLESKTLLATFL